MHARILLQGGRLSGSGGAGRLESLGTSAVLSIFLRSTVPTDWTWKALFFEPISHDMCKGKVLLLYGRRIRYL